MNHGKKGVIMQKKAQSGMNAAILVAIIAGLIIIYIIFLPTSQKEKFLENNGTGAGNGENNPNVLLVANPGSLSTSQGLEDQKSIPDAFLLETTAATELKSINPFIVRNGWFDKNSNKVQFDVDDPANVDNVILSFTTKKKLGILTIKLNNQVIFESEITSNTPEPVKIDKKQLLKTNTLEFSVSSVGPKFWTTNEYAFENAKILGDITDTSRQESNNIFTLTDSEFSSMDKATLKFMPNCGNVVGLGILDIFVNNKKIFTSVPVCDNIYKQSIPKSVLNEGGNTIVFKTNKGSYSVEQIKILLDFKTPKVQTYFFEVDQGMFNKIRDGSKDVILTIKFTDSNTQKRLNLNVNDHSETVETAKAVFSKNINSKISEGNNFVRLEPLQDVEVAELRIELV